MYNYNKIRHRVIDMSQPPMPHEVMAEVDKLDDKLDSVKYLRDNSKESQGNTALKLYEEISMMYDNIINKYPQYNNEKVDRTLIYLQFIINKKSSLNKNKSTRSLKSPIKSKNKSTRSLKSHSKSKNKSLMVTENVKKYIDNLKGKVKKRKEVEEIERQRKEAEEIERQRKEAEEIERQLKKNESLKTDNTIKSLNEFTIIDYKNNKTTYNVNKSIGAGGMGTVYSCSDNICKNYAVKFENDYNQVRISKEIENLQKLLNADAECNKYILCIKNYGTYFSNSYNTNYNGKIVIIYEYLRNYKTLKNLIQSYQTDLQIQLDKIIPNLIGGMHYMHKKGVYHKDIKPNNIMYNPENGDIKYIDWGLSCNTTENDNTNCNDEPGTPEYIYIGQGNKNAAYYKTSDWYSLMLSIYEIQYNVSFKIMDSNSKWKITAYKDKCVHETLKLLKSKNYNFSYNPTDYKYYDVSAYTNYNYYDMSVITNIQYNPKT